MDDATADNTQRKFDLIEEELKSLCRFYDEQVLRLVSLDIRLHGVNEAKVKSLEGEYPEDPKTMAIPPLVVRFDILLEKLRTTERELSEVITRIEEIF